MKRFDFLSMILAIILVVSTCILPTTAVIAQAETQSTSLYYGDINGNGEIDKFDYILVKRYCMGTIEFNDDQLIRGDVNKDGEIEKFDYILVKRHVMGTFEIPPLEECDHNYIPVVTPPTETEKGYTTHTCDKCGDSYVDSYVDPVTPPKKGLSYSVNADGTTCTVTGIGDYNGTELTIPSSIDGYTVTAIGEGAFYNCVIIIIVIIPNTVTHIAKDAFNGCQNLKEITIPSSVTSIENGAFSGCNSLKDVYFNGDITNWLDIAFAAGNANPCCNGARLYFGGELVTDITVPDGITEIGSYAFYGCISIININISGNVTFIGNDAFRNCIFIVVIIIGDSVTDIGDYAFYGCTALPSVIIPDNVTSLGSYAFSGCTSLISVVLGNGITEISDATFFRCSALESITLGNSISSIGANAFNGCDSIVEINYVGSEEEWNNIDFGPDGDDIRDFDVNFDYVPKCDHTYGDWETVTEPTCTENGEMKRVCTLCGNEETAPISALGHTYGDWKNDGEYHWKECSCGDIGEKSTHNYTSTVTPPTETESGFTTHTCTECGYSFTDSYVDPLKPASTGLKYSLNPDGTTCTITGIGTCTDNDLIIPSAIDGHKVVAIGNSAFYSCSQLTSVIIPDSVTSIGVSAFYQCANLKYNTYDNAYYLGSPSNPCFALIKAHNKNITSCSINPNTKIIYGSAFCYCTQLTSITIPDSVIWIGVSTFEGCTKLTDAVIPNSINALPDYMFNGCSSLVEVSFPANLTAIGASAFAGCYNLTDITLPDSVNTFGSGAFSGCGFTEFTVPNGTTVISESMFANCSNLVKVNIPDSVTEIYQYAFQSCYSLVEFTIPKNVTAIYRGVFNSCTNLKTVIMHDNLTQIGMYAFRYCNGLINITLPDSVWYINEYAFASCSNLTEADLGNGVSTIAKSAFSGCTSLTSVKIPESCTYIYDYAFYGCASLKNVYYAGSYDEWRSVTIKSNNEYLTNATIHYNYKPASVGLSYNVNSDSTCVITGIGTCTDTDLIIPSEIDGYKVTAIVYEAFKKCTNLTSVTIPDSVTSIGGSAFCACYNLTSVTIPDSVTKIGDYAFEKCINLTSITIPDSVTSIGKYAFFDCTELTNVIVGNGVPTISYAAFQGCSKLANATIGSGVTSIDYAAFNNCNNLTDIYYIGSEEDWANISIGGYNAPLAKATIHYNYKPESSVMTYEEFLAAEIDAPVCVETYVQGNQSWWNETIVLYCQSKDGGYYVYNVACSEEDAAKLVKGTKIRVTGYKSIWSGEIEILDATFEFVDDGDTYIAEPTDVTYKLGSDELIDNMNQLVTFKGLTVQSIEYKNGEPGDDIYLTFTKDGNTLEAQVEIYLTDTDTDVYKTVEALKAGDVVDVTGFLYWYNGANPHITDIVIINN